MKWIAKYKPEKILDFIYLLEENSIDYLIYDEKGLIAIEDIELITDTIENYCIGYRALVGDENFLTPIRELVSLRKEDGYEFLWNYNNNTITVLHDNFIVSKYLFNVEEIYEKCKSQFIYKYIGEVFKPEKNRTSDLKKYVRVFIDVILLGYIPVEESKKEYILNYLKYILKET